MNGRLYVGHLVRRIGDVRQRHVLPMIPPPWRVFEFAGLPKHDSQVRRESSRFGLPAAAVRRCPKVLSGALDSHVKLWAFALGYWRAIQKHGDKFVLGKDQRISLAAHLRRSEVRFGRARF